MTRSLYPGTWDLPGGHVRPGEPPHHAVRRELREELGILVNPHPTPHVSFGDDNWTLDCWVFENWEGEVGNQEPDEHDEVRWCGLGQIYDLPLADERLRRVLLGHLKRDRVHSVALVEEQLGQQVDHLRRAWDPRTAQGVPAHVTFTYPEELG